MGKFYVWKQEDGKPAAIRWDNIVSIAPEEGNTARLVVWMTNDLAVTVPTANFLSELYDYSPATYTAFAALLQRPN